MSIPLITVTVRYEHDIVLARQRARQIAAIFNLSTRDQVRIATAVSEIVRNAFNYAGGGTVNFLARLESPQALEIKVADRGPGIPRLQEVLDGRYVSQTGLGMGIIGARQLMDEFTIESAPGSGTTVVIGMKLPREAARITPEVLAASAHHLTQEAPKGHLAELQQQNQELLATLDELEKRQRELAQLNKELEDTNRGVVALYAELDERADYLRRVSESKSQFLSNMTHEFRTPVNSILSLCRILLDRMDGELSSEQERQVTLMQRAANDLSEIVNDLLDLAKVEAGKTTIRPSEFSVESLFGALRGMLKPLLAHTNSVSLEFEESADVPPLITDESKVSQILRNLLSNALKFTESGEVRVRASAEPGGAISFAVSDTGIGIALEDQERVFEEFTQVEGNHQLGKRGTGLGLPLSRKLAELLGGSLNVRSQPGVGSTFTLIVPSRYDGPMEQSTFPDLASDVDPTRRQVLAVEDSRETLLIYEKYLKGAGYQLIPARTLKQARDALTRCRPTAVILDILLSHENAWGFLSELNGQGATRDIPVYVATVIENRRKAMALGARDFQTKPLSRDWLLQRLPTLPLPDADEILIVDDDDAARSVLRELLRDSRFRLIEASGGREGVCLARTRKPAAVLMDLLMPDLNGLEAVRLLRSDAATRDLPIVIHTAQVLTAAECESFASLSAPVVLKDYTDGQVVLRRIREALAQAGLKQEETVCIPRE